MWGRVATAEPNACHNLVERLRVVQSAGRKRGVSDLSDTVPFFGIAEGTPETRQSMACPVGVEDKERSGTADH